MKALKVILIIIVVVVGGYSAWMATLPSDYSVERSTMIDAEPEAVYAVVSDFKTWGEWSSWHKKDTAMAITYGETSAGEGASYTWDGEIAKKGTQTITKAVPNESLETKISFDDMGESNGSWTFEKTEDNMTKVTWGFSGEFPFFFRVFGRGMDEAVGGDFEEGLGNLKTMIEAMPKEEPAVEITMVMVEAMPYYGIKSDVSWDEMDSDFFGANYGEIMTYLKTDGTGMTMQPFAIYHVWDEENKRTTVEPGIAIPSDMEGNDRVVKSMTHGGSALKAVHVGGYNTKPEHEAIYARVEKDELEMLGSPWEVYVTDPALEPDTAKWITEVYYPVGDPADAGEPGEMEE